MWLNWTAAFKPLTLSPPSFLSTLLPPTSSALSHLLNRGGFPPAHSDTHEPAFTALLDETRDLLTSPDFALVLERALDRATSLLFDGLSQNVFVGDESEEGEVRLRTAGVLPGLARWSSLALNGMPNELVDVRVFPLRAAFVCMLTWPRSVC
jgi:peroxin-3